MNFIRPSIFQVNTGFTTALGLADLAGEAFFAALGLAVLTGVNFFIFNLAALTALALASTSPNPLSSAIFLLASEKLLAVKDCLL